MAMGRSTKWRNGCRPSAGKITTIAYNNRNLVTGISYNDTTPSVGYGYDDYGARTSMTDGEGAMSFVYDGSRRLQSETRTFSGLAGKSYQFTYSFGLGGQLNQANYAALNASSFHVPIKDAQPARSEVALQGGTPPHPADKFGRGLSYSSRLTALLPALRNLTTQFGATITGKVKRAAAYGGQPMVGATVNCTIFSGSGSSASTMTDANGNYTCSGLAAGSNTWYTVSVSKPGWSWTPPSTGIQTWSSGTYTANFEAAPSSSTTTMAGTVTTPGGQAISGATITLTGSQHQTTTSAANGSYSLTVNTLGTYTLVASKTGQEFTPVTVNIGDFVTPQTVHFHGVPQQAGNPPPTGNTFFSRNVNYAYKANGALASLGTSMIGGDALSTTNVIESLNYKAFGAASQISYGNDRRLYLGYNEMIQLVSMSATRWDGTDSIVARTYGYTENGLISNSYGACQEFSVNGVALSNQLRQCFQR